MTTERVSAVIGGGEDDSALGRYDDDDEDDLEAFSDGELGCEDGGRRGRSHTRVGQGAGASGRLEEAMYVSAGTWSWTAAAAAEMCGCVHGLWDRSELHVRHFKKLSCTLQFYTRTLSLLPFWHSVTTGFLLSSDEDVTCYS